MAKIDDVAKMAGVSAATVSRVLNGVQTVKESTRKKVEWALNELSYRPNQAARGLARSKDVSLGLVVGTFFEPFFISVTESVSSVCAARGVSLVTAVGGADAESEQKAVDSLLDHGCRAIVLHTKYMKDSQLQVLLDRIPGLVLLNRKVEGFEHRCVWLDNQAGARQMFDRLYQFGHRYFAYINRSSDIDDAHDRLSGWREQAMLSGVSFDEADVSEGDCTFEGGYAALISLYERNRFFTGLLCYDDTMAVGAIRALKDIGKRVPVDVSVIGFNDSYVARATIPKITTMHYPVVQMAHEAGMLALRMSENEGVIASPLGRFVPVIVPRQSDRFFDAGGL